MSLALYPPALALALEDCEHYLRRHRGVGPSATVRLLEHVLAYHWEPRDGYFQARALTTNAYLGAGRFYWIVGAYPPGRWDGVRLVYVSDDLTVYARDPADFDLGEEALERLLAVTPLHYVDARDQSELPSWRGYLH